LLSVCAAKRPTGALAVLNGDADSAAIARACAGQGLELAGCEDPAELLAAARGGACVLLRAERSRLDAAASTVASLLEAGAGPVLVLCEEPRPWELRGLLEAGASGVLLERELASALGPCLKAVRAGQVCVPKVHASQLEPPPLSAREKQVLGLVVMGHTNGEIASRLFLAESTVKSHLSSAFGKLGVRSRNEAVEAILGSERGPGAGILGLSVEQVV
jgi:DNA-binding NarL/FixJ family response regulator